MTDSRTRTAVVLAVAVGLVGVVLSHWPLMASLEKRYGHDFLFKLRGARPAPTGVVVVAIDDASFIERGVDPLAPWPRELHAELVRILKDRGARSVAFDVLFETPGDPASDVQFELALFDANNVVLGSTIDRTEDPRFRQARLIEPYRPFAESAAAVGEVSMPQDGDGVIRESWLYTGDRPSLALAAYEVATGDLSFRGDRGSRLIDYYGPPRTINTVSLYQALDPDQYLPDGFFQDRVVFVGLSQVAATQIGESKDSFPTPFSGGVVGFTYGVEVHATIAANLLEGRHLDRPTIGWIVAWSFGLALLAAFLFIFLRPLTAAVALFALIGCVWVVGYGALTFWGRSIAVILPALIQAPISYGASTLWYYLTTVRQREKIRRAFALYLSPEMSRRISEESESLSLGGEEVVGTALFTDVQGFTSIAEDMTATETAKMLNEYFSAITTKLFETGGTLIKYIGDAVFAIWGAPVRMEDHAPRACRAALAMAAQQESTGDSPASRLVTRIGVHCGPMLVGNLGSSQRFDYTAIGDTINLAARLESLNKTTGTRVLVSGEAIAAAGDEFISRFLGRVRVVGRADPVELYELLGSHETPGSIDADTLSIFGDAVTQFTSRRFREAVAGFEETCRRRGGTDGPSEWYLSTIAGFESDPPPQGWDGVIQLAKK
ncbi:MAG: adenylate/guanylate cyclase domain-containing protein [Acidobacteriota bacterium]|nr:adenylate/guanylate cyclase domain-containing protein [Acidobacteriota bacterium]MDH3786127.1 adenylate/guanylate cyclase domain-containing protein [Acidobacteriota bacterium]